MNKIEAIQILEALASGCSPSTGEILTKDAVLNERNVIRALQIAIDELRRSIYIEETPLQQKKKRNKKVEPMGDIDFFKQETFNNFPEGEKELLISNIEKLGIKKIENLNQQIINARTKDPRAHEEWSPEEKTMLRNAIRCTNDLSLLSECFQRSKKAIEKKGKEIIYEEGHKEECIECKVDL